MWYILKPILIILFCLIVLLYKSLEYVCVLLFRLFFFFKWTKYSYINNNEGNIYYEADAEGWRTLEVEKGSDKYSEEKNPIESLREYYLELKSI